MINAITKSTRCAMLGDITAHHDQSTKPVNFNTIKISCNTSSGLTPSGACFFDLKCFMCIPPCINFVLLIQSPFCKCFKTAYRLDIFSCNLNNLRIRLAIYGLITNSTTKLNNFTSLLCLEPSININTNICL